MTRTVVVAHDGECDVAGAPDGAGKPEQQQRYPSRGDLRSIACMTLCSIAAVSAEEPPGQRADSDDCFDLLASPLYV